MKRQPRRTRRDRNELGIESARLIQVAGKSLGLTDEQIAAAADEPSETADMLEARVLELLEHLHGRMNEHGNEARARLEQRRGAGFIKRVAAMGLPVAKVLATFALFVALLVGSRPSAALSLHNVSPRKWRPRRRLHYRNRWRWGQSRGSSDNFTPRSSSHSALRIGCARARTSSSARVGSSKSFFAGGGGGFGLVACQRTNRISLSSSPMGPSSDHPGAEK